LKGNYGYNKNNVILTGMPRYDNLEKIKNYIEKEKIIIILPTWRNYIKSSYDAKTFESILLKSSLLITDYSSIFFDFGYLKKPIIYAHFDYDEYRANHFHKGYFDYIKDGFGPVCFNLTCVINNIILQMNIGCLLEKKYLKRINNFFKNKDDKNCERLFSRLTNKIDDDNKLDNENKLFIIIFFILLIFKKIY